jgi:hypothetical protein
LITIVPDDAGYFLEIAENAAAGKGLTFDGINRTNGFQPLWLYTLVLLHYAFKVQPEIMFRIGMVVQALLAFAAGILFYRILARIFSGRAVLISGIVFVFFVFFLSINLMESALLVFSLSLLFFSGWMLRVFSTYSRLRHFVFGLLLGLTFLARLDTVFIILAVFFFCLAQIVRSPVNRMEKVRRLVFIILGSSLIISPYLAYNLFSFGSIMPISGALKSSFPRISGPGYAFSLLTKRNWGEIAIAITYFAWFFIRGRRSSRPDSGLGYFRLCMAVLSLSVLMHFIHTSLFMKWAIFRWHFVTYTLLATLVLNELAEYTLSRSFFERRRAIYRLAVILMIIGGSIILFKRHSQPFKLNWTVESYKAALWTRRNTDENAVLAMKDAGIFGYFSERSVINLDGVVNNMKYQEVLDKRKLGEYLERNGVRYLAKHAFFGREDITDSNYNSYAVMYFSFRYNTYSDEILLRREDEVYRSDPYINESNRTVFLIFKMKFRKG